MTSFTRTWLPDAEIDESVRTLRSCAQRIRIARTIADTLYWDDRVERPRAAASWRALQRAHQAEELHALLVGDELHAAISRVEDTHGEHVEARAMRRARDHVRNIPRAVAARREAVASAARAAWDDARTAGDFRIFEPHLDAMVQTMRAYADGVGYERERYEACIAEWEPGIDLATIDRTFAELRDALVPRLSRRNTTAKSITLRALSPSAMRTFEQRVVDLIGFDLDAGRIVRSDRAFCIALGPGDVRMTSRFHTTPGFRGIHSTIHEAGHGVYAQALGRLELPATIATAPGLGMDEAQSRMFENRVGRSRAFTAWAFRQLRELDPAAYPTDDEYERFHTEITTADSAVRRLGTDELTYNLHIMLRTAIERDLVNGELEASELPDAWRARSLELLGAEPVDDVEGCLQDVHWSLGQWGYFPTYTLGNLYFAQLLETAQREMATSIDAGINAGSTSALRAWLDDNVYVHGAALTGLELVERVSGAPLSIEPLLNHLDHAFPARGSV